MKDLFDLSGILDLDAVGGINDITYDLLDMFGLSGVTASLKSSPEQIKKDKVALKGFMANFHFGHDLSDTQAKQNVENGVVEIVDGDGHHCSNALLVTKNGYFVTSYHWVDNITERPLYVVTEGGKKRRIVRVCGYSIKCDVALAKADLHGSEEPMVYRFVNSYTPHSVIPVIHLARKNFALIYNRGHIDNPPIRNIQFDDGPVPTGAYVPMRIKVIPGDSGGVIVTPKYEVYGVLSRAVLDGSNVAYCTFWFQALNIIQKVIGVQKS